VNDLTVTIARKRFLVRFRLGFVVGAIATISVSCNDKEKERQKQQEAARYDDWRKQEEEKAEAARLRTLELVETMLKMNPDESRIQKSPPVIQAWFEAFQAGMITEQEGATIIKKEKRLPVALRNFDVRFWDNSRTLTEADKLNGLTGQYAIAISGKPTRSIQYNSRLNASQTKDYSNRKWTKWEDERISFLIHIEVINGAIKESYQDGCEFEVISDHKFPR
jgi:hypothetical protein